jgi:hypothetical protein
MELEVIVFIVIGVIIAYLAYRMFLGKSKDGSSDSVSHDVVAPPSVDVIQSSVPAVAVSEVKTPELKVEAGGKQSTKPRSRRPRNPKPKAVKTDAVTEVKPAAKPANRPRARIAAKPTPK